MKPSVFINTDIVLDFLMDNEPHASFAAEIFARSEEKKLTAYISPLTLSRCYSVLRKVASHAKVIRHLQNLLLITNITSISKQDVAAALNSGFPNLEEALQHYSAISHASMHVILTRNRKEYKHSEVPVMSAENYLKVME